MNNTFNFLAFDLGATSGRSILGTFDNGKLELRELTRFGNDILQIQGKYYWNIYSIYNSIKEGMRAAASLDIAINAIGIDTWGVDFVYVAEDGTILNLPRSYRDPYTERSPEKYFKLIPKEEVYKLTGIQIMNFNSLFQLYAAKMEKSAALQSAKEILFLPDALSYLLSGNKACEYTIASTSQFLNPLTKKIENKLLEAIEVHPSVIPPLIKPGKVVGLLRDSIAKECGLNPIPIIAVAGHDTASAIVSIPAKNKKFAYISSGTWSLMGIEVDEPIINEQSYKMNFTNEGGVEGTIRFLKNITGMWLLEQCRKEWEQLGRTYTYDEIIKMAKTAKGFQCFVDPDDAVFANPESMIESIIKFCTDTGQSAPKEDAEFIRCIFESLALKYKYVLSCLCELSPHAIEVLHIIGGGSQNKLLNQFTANATGLPVVAGPYEATAIGNIMMQAKGLGLVKSLKEIRTIINESFTLESYEPQDTELWNNAYEKFLKLIEK
ncbi:MAG: rhamnulokinase [Dysgonomonas mossii]|uniref:rhamnulokinase n=1 Tax=Dysgonomonas mossii TaxID=163665 RepID=UPI001D490E55|nr:FGGY-family carbohydrate kinase [Dysgonomonas mossii]MBS5797638.1 rhamnulokinase [Dysgonomonas mossii]MBS7112366.1 rhamnulokinase [Dysgonomonas mossii]